MTHTQAQGADGAGTLRDSFPVRRGDWMQTFTGRRFWPLDPRPADVCIEDIAHALALQTRFGGHCLRFYSVAEHCVHLARATSAEHALWALLHDASEAYIADIVRPLKRHLDGYGAAEIKVMGCVCEAFDLDGFMPDEVKERDCRILIDERAQVMLSTGEAWHYGGASEPLGVTLQFWTPEQAEREFLATFAAITGLPATIPATPAPAATPGVPDSLREEVTLADANAAILMDRARNGGWVDLFSLNRSEMSAAWSCLDWVRALIAAQPAGQAGDAGAEETCAWAGGNDTCYCRTCGEEYRYGREDKPPCPRKPSPNSTRTGAAETEVVEAVARAIFDADEDVNDAKEAELRAKGNHVAADCLAGPRARWDDPRNAPISDAFRHRARKAIEALAARPEAPSDAGWSREDLEAFVAREWPEGRSAGAAARELVRALGARGLAPTLQRLLTDLLGQINFASTDRAQILADFANAAPEAARMAKIDSFERWNPRVFDPTPPSDPAPSGQAEG